MPHKVPTNIITRILAKFASASSTWPLAVFSCNRINSSARPLASLNAGIATRCNCTEASKYFPCFNNSSVGLMPSTTNFLRAAR